jgi:hypothetical protein
MGKINLGRVILGGLLAGLIISISEYVLNTYVMAADTSELLQRLGLAEIGTNQIIGFIVLTFVLGIVMIWLYAAIRPRFGAGVKTAIIAAVVVWIFGLLSGLSDVIVGLIPAGTLVLPAVWGLVETIVAAVAGAWVYQEA